MVLTNILCDFGWKPVSTGIGGCKASAQQRCGDVFVNGGEKVEMAALFRGKAQAREVIEG